MADSPATRTKPSVRSLVAVTGAAAMAVTLAHATATQATPSSTVSSEAQVATGNYYPTPLTPEVRCRTNPDGIPNWNRRAEVSWEAVSEATGYRLEIVDLDSEEVWLTFDVDENTTMVPGISVSDGRPSAATSYATYARVRTRNGPALSSGYAVADNGPRHGWGWTTDRTQCDGDTGEPASNAVWENTHEWDPNTQAPAGNRAGVTELRSARVSDGDKSVQETAEPTDSTSATSTDVSTSASAPTTSDSSASRTTSPETSTSSPSTPSTSSPTTSPERSAAPGTPTPPTTTDTTRQVKPQLTRTTTAPSGTVTAGMTADGRVVLVNGDGIQLVDGEVGSSVELQWQNGVDILWIIGPKRIHRIMKSADGTWKFYLDSGQNLPAGIG